MQISIVTPSFNQRHFIQKTMDSVLSQPGDVEYFVIDGGSTDGTVELLEEYKKTYNNFDYVSEPDNGQSDAINKGLAKCSGEILAYINADDLYEEGVFETVRRYFRDNPELQWAYGKYRIIDENGGEIRKFFKWYKNFAGRRYSYRKLLRVNIISQPSAFWRREVYEKMGGFSEELHLVMDYEYWCRIGEKFPAARIPEILSSYRFYDNSKSGSDYATQYMDEYRVAKEYAKGRYPLTVAAHYLSSLRMIVLMKILSWLKL